MAQKEKNYCQGCGQEHKASDMVRICLFCLQSKFIPRLSWHEVGFIDKRTLIQWWNHIKTANTKELKTMIYSQLKATKVKEAMGIKTKQTDIDDFFKEVEN